MKELCTGSATPDFIALSHHLQLLTISVSFNLYFETHLNLGLKNLGCDFWLWLLVGIGYWDGGGIGDWDWGLGLGIGIRDWDLK